MGFGDREMHLQEFIIKTWPKTIREAKADDGKIIPLPKPFTVPSVKDHFQEMYYWDTYFTNVGLFASGLTEQAINNCENMAYVIKKIGFFPNATRNGMLNRTQQPYFALVVKDIYDITQDDAWLQSQYDAIKTEYEWWMKNRITPIGLNRYADNGVIDEHYRGTATCGLKRLGLTEYDGDYVELGKHFYSIFESGWDCCPRFDLTCQNACPIDLNSNLYFYESFLAALKEKFAIADDTDYAKRANTRKQLIEKYLWNEQEQLYFDYNFVTGKQFTCKSAAAFHPYFVGLAGKEKINGLQNAYAYFVKEYGVACTDKYYGEYQWAYPSGWAPNQYVAYKALKNYGLDEHSQTVAKKYTSLCESVFEQTGDLWEKYNVVEGNDHTCDEAMVHHTMMGWTAGVYMYLVNELQK